MADVADEIALASEVANVEDPEAAVKSEEPEAKRARTEAAAEDAKSAEEAGAVAGKEGDAKPEPETIKRDPIKIGYKTFSSGVDCYKYFHNLIVKYRKNQDLNEYEFHNILELIKSGHPEADRKLAGGVLAIQIRDVFTAGVASSCFHLLRNDGTIEDVSYRKCIANLFPEMHELVANQNGARSVGGGGRKGRGRGRGGGGRGGRGRGRGRH